MTTKSQRKQQMKYVHITSIVVGIFIALCGLYFTTGIRSNTNAKIAKCTEKTVGTVSDVKQSGSKYLNTVDYVAEDVECTAEYIIKQDLVVGTQLDVYYEPLTVSHIYIPNVSPTGADDVKTGLIMILAGAAFIAVGIFLKKLKDKEKAKKDL